MLHFNTFLKVYNKLILVGKESVYTHSHLYTINMQFLKSMDGKHNDKQLQFISSWHAMMTTSTGHIFRVTDPLWGEPQ